MKELIESRERLSKCISEKPMVHGLPCFSVNDHIASVKSWIEERNSLQELVLRLEKIHTPWVLEERDEYSRRKKIFLEKHYPSGVYK